MKMTKRVTRLFCTIAIVGMTYFCPDKRAYAQVAVNRPVVTASQLAALTPDEQDLPGFVSIRPDDGSPPRAFSEPPGDSVLLNYDLTQMPVGLLNTGSMSRLVRRLFSTNGAYVLEMDVRTYDTPETAEQALQEHFKFLQVSPKRGTSGSMSDIGDESYVMPSSSANNHLLFRAGKVRAEISGCLSPNAQTHREVLDFPPAALEAIAYQILLRASQQPELTGVSSQQARMNVNGHVLPPGALRVAGRVYVPAQAFALAMGLTSRWDAKTGALTLSGIGHKTVVVTAGSTAATVGGVVSPALTVPVLKQAGQPVMALDDLLTLTGGRVVGREGGTVRVKA